MNEDLRAAAAAATPGRDDIATLMEECEIKAGDIIIPERHEDHDDHLWLQNQDEDSIFATIEDVAFLYQALPGFLALCDRVDELERALRQVLADHNDECLSCAAKDYTALAALREPKEGVK